MKGFGCNPILSGMDWGSLNSTGSFVSFVMTHQLRLWSWVGQQYLHAWKCLLRTDEFVMIRCLHTCTRTSALNAWCVCVTSELIWVLTSRQGGKCHTRTCELSNGREHTNMTFNFFTWKCYGVNAWKRYGWNRTLGGLNKFTYNFVEETIWQTHNMRVIMQWDL